MSYILPKVLAWDAADAALEISENMRLMEEIEPTDLASLGALADFIAGHVAED